MMLNNAAEHGLPSDLDSQPTSNLAGVGEESLENTQLNLYRFVGNNPVNYADPLGLAYKSCVLLEQTCTSSKNVRIRSGLFWVTVKVCTRRKCKWRCYHDDPNTCFNIPCKNRACHEEKDHGVEELNYYGPDPTKPFGAAPLCAEKEPSVIAGGK
jgi:hypothetical protein